MKKTLTRLILTSISLLSISNTTQAQWVVANTPNPVPASLYIATHFFNGNKGVTVGSATGGFAGSAYQTNDGAQSWTSPINANGFFNDVDFPNSNVGYAVSILGEIIKTNNGGSIWNFQTSGTNNALFGVSFVSKDTGWAVGDMGTLLATTNGGTTWNTISANINASTTTLFKVQFLNANLGYTVGGNGVVYKTTNRAITWTPVAVSGNGIRNLHFLNSNEGYVVGTNGTIFKTTNGGLNWVNTSPINLVDTANTKWFGVHFTSTDTGYVVGWDDNIDVGYILKTKDGGTTWNTQLAAPTEAMWGIHFPTKDTGYAVGINIYKTINGGDSSVTTSVSTITLKGTKLITVYPNPTSENITIQLKTDNTINTPLNFAIYNNVGQLVLQENNIKNNFNLSVAQLPQGIYTYTVAAEDGSVKEQGKLIKR